MLSRGPLSISPLCPKSPCGANSLDYFMSTLLLGQVLIKFSQQMNHSPEISPCFEQVFALSTPLLPFFCHLFCDLFFAIFFHRRRRAARAQPRHEHVQHVTRGRRATSRDVGGRSRRARLHTGPYFVPHSGRAGDGNGDSMRVAAESGRPGTASTHERFAVRRSATARDGGGVP